jgi:hypothetical protein
MDIGRMKEEKEKNKKKGCADTGNQGILVTSWIK